MGRVRSTVKLRDKKNHKIKIIIEVTVPEEDLKSYMRIANRMTKTNDEGYSYKLRKEMVIKIDSEKMNFSKDKLNNKMVLAFLYPGLNSVAESKAIIEKLTDNLKSMRQQFSSESVRGDSDIKIVQVLSARIKFAIGLCNFEMEILDRIRR